MSRAHIFKAPAVPRKLGQKLCFSEMILALCQVHREQSMQHPTLKMTRHLLAILSGATILGLVPHARATPISAFMGAQSTVNYYQEAGGLTIAQDNQAWTGTPGSLSVNTTATGISQNGSTATTFNRGTGTWAADGNSGMVTIDYGWSVNTHDVGAAVATGSIDPLYEYNWSYTFTPDTSGLFVMNASIVGTGSSSDPTVAYPMFGLEGFDIIGSAFIPLGLNSIDPTTSGTVSQWVDAGSTYTMVLRNGGNLSGGLSEREAAVHAEFSWSLPGTSAAVPETSGTLALLGLGLGGLGFASRQLRRTQAA